MNIFRFTWYKHCTGLRKFESVSRRRFSKPVTRETNETTVSSDKPIVDEDTITKIEKLSLVGFDKKHATAVLEEAIRFTERLRTVDIPENVEPMYSVLENEPIPLREDVVTVNNNRKKILKNASVLEEEYFVVPMKNKETES